MRKNRIIVASLFLIWIGGMYFFLVGQHHNSFETSKSREEYILRGRKVRLKGRVANVGNDGPNIVNTAEKMRDGDKREISDLDAAAYVSAAKLKPDEDPYARNAYNQKESDKIAVDREVPDVRDAK